MAVADAWNPGIGSTIPHRLQPAVTLFRPENAFVGFAEAHELAELVGLDPVELASLRPERLVVHELLVRVTADLTVPDGPNYADLGISLRAMVATLLERHVAPHLDGIAAAFDAERERAAACIERHLSERLFPAEPAAVRGAEGDGGEGRGEGRDGGGRSWLARLFGRSPASSRAAAPAAASAAPPELGALAAWRAALAACDTPLERACLAALIRTVDGIVARRGRLFAERELITRIALVFVGNERGAELIGERLEPVLAEAVAREGYRTLPPQAEPVVLNVKGASASGKSTIRPRQRLLAEKLGIAWEDFALISPDYWRKYLLDYDSLGEDFRYAAMLTGRELEIVDRKLDRYMAAKAARGAMSHLLIDRFRFDSFAPDEGRAEKSRLLSRFGHHVYLFFVVTPPAATVERAWTRGLATGRYKAVDDLLYHNVEAFTGMPALFLSWVGASDKRVHVEFLDNDVPKGSLPRTAAFGWNDSLVVLDVGLMLDIDRYRCVNVEARCAEEVLDEIAVGESGAARAAIGPTGDAAGRYRHRARRDLPAPLRGAARPPRVRRSGHRAGVRASRARHARLAGSGLPRRLGRRRWRAHRARCPRSRGGRRWRRGGRSGSRAGRRRARRGAVDRRGPGAAVHGGALGSGRAAAAGPGVGLARGRRRMPIASRASAGGGAIVTAGAARTAASGRGRSARAAANAQRRSPAPCAATVAGHIRPWLSMSLAAFLISPFAGNRPARSPSIAAR